MTSVSFPPNRPDGTSKFFKDSSSSGFGAQLHAKAHVSGLHGAGGASGKRSKRNHQAHPSEMTTLSTKRKGVNPFDGASSDDNRRRKTTHGANPGDWKKKGAQAHGGRSNGAKRATADATDYETDDTYGESEGDGTAYSERIFSQLRKDGIAPPKWPSDPGNTSQKAAMAKFREEYKNYRDRARGSLMRAGLIDDPDKPKRLEDAIVFKGICDAMCPDFEKITRITEFDVQSAEKDARAFAVTSRMVKKLARSAAGQEAPLPMDVRSTASLRKTLDYLIDDLVQTDDKLATMHGFLWDRTRAIRRDFIFHSTMTPEEMLDQVYCLETIARFHVTSLHLLSQAALKPEDFSEQQEIEQLGKSLLSLMFAYDDCKPQGVVCQNEAEFRAYHLLFSANKPNILEDVQKEWGDSRFWTESDDIRTAVSLVESLQNATDFHGPLGSGPSMAVSGAHRTYFKIVQSRQVSYTMACFAEIHLGQLRRSALQSLKKAYTRPRHAAKDITPATLNRFLYFDTEQQAVEFAEQHGLAFVDGESPSGELVRYLDTSNRMSWPRIHHCFSQKMVERKRGSRTLPEVIHSTILDESTTDNPSFGSNNNGSISSQATTSNASQQIRFGTNLTSTSNGTIQSPFSAPQGQISTSLSGTSPFDKAAGGMTTGSTPQNPFSAPNTGFGPSPSLPTAQTAPSTATPAQNPFATNPSAFAQAKPIQQSSPFGSSPFASQTNGAAKPSVASAVPPSAFGTIAQQTTPGFGQAAQTKPATQPQPKMTNEPSPAITVTPPTPQFSLPGSSGTAARLPSFKPETTPSAASAPSPFGGSAFKPAAPAAEAPKPAVLFAPPSSSAKSSEDEVKAAGSQSPFAGLATSSLSSPKPVSPGAVAGQFPQPSVPLQSDPSQEIAKSAPPSQPSPLAGIAGVISDGVPSTNASKAMPPPPKPPAVKQLPKRDLMGDFARWFVTGDNGLMQEFERFMVEQIVGEAFELHKKQEEERVRREEEEKNLAEARRFQVYNLSVKYFYRWRETARNLRLSKLRRQEREEYRRIQKEMREEETKKKKKAAQVAEARRKALERDGIDSVEELRELLQLKKDREPQMDAQAEAEALLATGILSGVANERDAISTIIGVPSFADPVPPPPASSTPSLSRSTSSSKPRGAKTRALMEEFSKTSNFRKSLPPMSSHSTSSRFSASESPQKRLSKVSDRWRLKAMGLVTMPDGSALPEAIANDILYNGKRYDGLGSFGLDSSTRRGRSVSADLNHAAEARKRFSQSLNGRSPSRQTNGTSPLSKRKRSIDDVNEGRTVDERITKRASSNTEIDRLLREAKENRESLRSSRVDLDEGAVWFREQNEMMQVEETSRRSTPWGKEGH